MNITPRLVCLIVSFASSFLVSSAQGEAQVLNPHYIKARDLLNQADSETIRVMLDRWKLLVNEQAELWRLAGEVDKLTAQGILVPWLETYNDRVRSWQMALDQFSAGVQLSSAAFHSKNAVEKRTPEEISEEARKAFDRRGDFAGKVEPSRTVYSVNLMRDADIPKKEWESDTTIASAIEKREVAKQEWKKAEADLKVLETSDPTNLLKKQALRQQSDTAKNVVIYENFSIGDRVNALSRQAKSQ